MNREEIEIEVENAITSATLWITKSKVMHFSLVPAKPLNQGGLGIGLGVYQGFLRALVNDYLPQKKPFKDYKYPRGFAVDTHNLPLRNLRYQLTNNLYAREQVPVAGLKTAKQGKRTAHSALASTGRGTP